jgi:predicted PurR-regulated permease PerM
MDFPPQRPSRSLAFDLNYVQYQNGARYFVLWQLKPQNTKHGLTFGSKVMRDKIVLTEAVITERQYVSFAKYVLVASVAVACVVSTVVFVWYAAELLLLVFTGVLLSILLRGCGRLIEKVTGLGRGLSIAVAAAALLAFVIAAVWLMMGGIGIQVAELQLKIPQAIQGVRDYVAEHEWARRLVDSLPNIYEWFSTRTTAILTSVTGFASTTFGIVVDIVLIVIVGLYLSFQPELYSSHLIRLLPFAFRKRAQEVLTALDDSLWRWLRGRFILMAINGFLTGIGLWLLGVPLASTLGLLAGLMNMVPNFGPWIAAIPAILVAFLQSPQQALYTIILYIVLQSIDGYVFTPLVDRKSVDLSPVLTIVAQILFGVAFGFAGVLLASPLTAVIVILVRMLYVEDLLGDTATPAIDAGRVSGSIDPTQNRHDL